MLGARVRFEGSRVPGRQRTEEIGFMNRTDSISIAPPHPHPPMHRGSP